MIKFFQKNARDFFLVLYVGRDNIEGSLYVDDFLCYQGNNMYIIERELQLCLNKIEKWAMENGFIFSS